MLKILEICQYILQQVVFIWLTIFVKVQNYAVTSLQIGDGTVHLICAESTGRSNERKLVFSSLLIPIIVTT